MSTFHMSAHHQLKRETPDDQRERGPSSSCNKYILDNVYSVTSTYFINTVPLLYH